MKIQYISDLHLELPENLEFLKANPLELDCDILIMAGDILPFCMINDFSDFLDKLSANHKLIYWMPGNHEFYGFDVLKYTGEIKEKVRDNIFIVNNTVVEHEGVRLIFSTMWSHIKPGNEYFLERGLKDFYHIRYGKYKFSSTRYNEINRDCVAFLKSEIEKEGSKIVTTHHVPTFMNYPEEYIGDIMNDAFATDLHDYIEQNGPHYWIFGHTHKNIEFNIGRTNMLTNQFGKVKLGQHLTFDRNKIIEI